MIQVYDVAGVKRAILTADADKVKEPWVDIRLNGESTLEFLLPLTSRKWSKITPECRIVADGREYVILRPDAVDAERTQDGKKWGKVTAAESWILLDKDFVSVSNDPDKPTPADMEVRIISGGEAAGGYPKGSAGSALTYILQGSGWTLDICDVEGVHDIETEKMSRLENIKKVQEIWGGYLVWDSIYRTVSLRAEATWQNYTGFQIRYAKNLKHITRTDNYDIVTRLYPFGKDDLDISSVNDGKKYVENFSYTANIYVGKYINQQIATPEELKERAIAELEKICKPRYTYRVGLVDLRELPEYGHEAFTVGDMADVIAPDVGTGRVRILRHKYNLFQRYLCELEIGDPEERLEEQLQASFQTTRYVNTSLGTIVIKNIGTEAGQVPVLNAEGKLDSSLLPSHTIPIASPTVLGGIKVGSGLSIDASGVLETEFGGSYDELTGKPPIPTKTSQLTNDSGFITSHEINKFNLRYLMGVRFRG